MWVFNCGSAALLQFTSVRSTGFVCLRAWGGDVDYGARNEYTSSQNLSRETRLFPRLTPIDPYTLAQDPRAGRLGAVRAGPRGQQRRQRVQARGPRGDGALSGSGGAPPRLVRRPELGALGDPGPHHPRAYVLKQQPGARLSLTVGGAVLFCED